MFVAPHMPKVKLFGFASPSAASVYVPRIGTVLW
jgi:hypothetical protein